MTSKPDTSVVVAVELPAPCGQHCPMCRTPQHGIGDPEAVKGTLANVLDSRRALVREIYIVSNGEPGWSNNFWNVISDAAERGIPISVACAHPISVPQEPVQGLVRVEVSCTQYTMDRSREAILKALDYGIPVTVSLVDDGIRNIEEALEALQREFIGGLSGFLIRALQAEGRSTEKGGATKFGRFAPYLPIGFFPVRAYKELGDVPQDFETVRINCWGQEVPFLGGYVDANKWD